MPSVIIQIGGTNMHKDPTPETRDPIFRVGPYRLLQKCKCRGVGRRRRQAWNSGGGLGMWRHKVTIDFLVLGLTPF